MNILKKMPVPVCGLALGLAAMGNLLSPYGNAIRYTCGIISLLLILCFTLKVINSWKEFAKELENPVALSSLPTYTMAIMLLATYIKPFIGVFAFYVWIVALILHFCIMLMFIKSFVFKFNIKTVFPSWFIVSVSFVVASVTSPVMNMKPLGQGLFYVGIAVYFVILPVILYRMIKVKQIPEPALPTIAIFAAPMSLCLSGYLSAFEKNNMAFVVFMLAICLVSYIFVLASILFKLIKLKFYPTFSAYTFPLVISAVAIKMANAFLTAKGITYLSFMPLIAMIIAVIAVAFVLYKYCVFWFAAKQQNS